MKDLSAAERRLIAALDRLDDVVERAAHRMATMQTQAPAPRPASSASAQGTDAGLSPQIAALHDRQAATLEAMQARLAEAHGIDHATVEVNPPGQIPPEVRPEGRKETDI